MPPVTFRYVEDFSEGFIIDTRSDLAAVLKTDDGWQVELNQVLEDLDARFLYLTIAHEAVHIKCPGKKHGSKEWNSEVRRLQGLGLFLRIF